MHTGYVLRIDEVHWKDYTARGWNSGEWGLTINMPIEQVDNSNQVKVSCPFSTKIQQPQ